MAVAGIGAAIKGFAGQTQSLSIFSREIGLSVKQLREMKAVGEHFGMGWDATQGSLKRFQDTFGNATARRAGLRHAARHEPG